MNPIKNVLKSNKQNDYLKTIIIDGVLNFKANRYKISTNVLTIIKSLNGKTYFNGRPYYCIKDGMK